MSVAENKALVRRFYEEAWDQGNTDFAYEVFADDYVRHDFRPTEALPGPAGQKKILAAHLTSVAHFRAIAAASALALGNGAGTESIAFAYGGGFRVNAITPGFVAELT